VISPSQTPDSRGLAPEILRIHGSGGPDPGYPVESTLIYTFTRARGREKSQLTCVTCVLHFFYKEENAKSCLDLTVLDVTHIP